MLLHITLAVVVPAFKFDVQKKETPKELSVELVKPKEPEPVPEIIPEPPKPPEPVKPEPIKQEPIKKQIEPKPRKIEPSPEPVTQAPPPPVDTPRVIATDPKPEAKPEVVVEQPPPPPPEPPKKTGPSDDEINAAKAAYISNVQRELKRNIRYPKLAQQRGIQGEVKLKVTLDNEGNVVDVSIVESSGNDTLDEAAIATVKRSNLKQYMKEILYGRLNTFDVPVAFILSDG